MSGTLVYMDTSDVREGALEDLKTAIEELARFVDANESRILAYNAYLSDDGTQMTVMHVHPDSASLELHMEVAGPAFRRFTELIKLSSIDIFGRPTEKVVKQLQEKARLLGGGRVTVHEPQAGFGRFEAR